MDKRSGITGVEDLSPVARQMGLDCMKIIIKKLSREMSREEYYLALMNLDKKYPTDPHWPPLSKNQYAEYGNIKEKNNETLQPFNFKEAAEMYVRHNERVENENPPLSFYKSKPKGLLFFRNKEEKPEPSKINQEHLLILQQQAQILRGKS